MNFLDTDWYRYLPALNQTRSKQEHKKEVEPEVINGSSITRLFLAYQNRDLFNELHISHYPTGDLKKPAQTYFIRRSPSDSEYLRLFERFAIPVMDHGVIMTLLGNFKWVRYDHTANKQERGGKIYVDTPGMHEGWSTEYF